MTCTGDPALQRASTLKRVPRGVNRSPPIWLPRPPSGSIRDSRGWMEVPGGASVADLLDAAHAVSARASGRCPAGAVRSGARAGGGSASSGHGQEHQLGLQRRRNGAARAGECSLDGAMIGTGKRSHVDAPRWCSRGQEWSSEPDTNFFNWSARRAEFA
ncbi:unnamed protein product [Phytophthora lilii]|uniref:Unnamed protein product n=1 Tax=Phytophthora lilii TaxID=2077276 RepID=A0A9W7CKK4_9STRA|nr:unnamed protein product [Phytophthora lilii]